MKRGPVNETFLKRHTKQIASMVLFCGTITIASGCAERKTHAIPWATVVMVRPNPPVHQGDGTSDFANIAPDLQVSIPANNIRVFGARPQPTRPRAAASPSQSEPGTAQKTPTIVPELSPQEAAEAKGQFAESMGIVDRNLAAARGRALSASQTDIISKVTGFVSEAREASSEGDWARARNLAKKAQILSQDLVASF